MFTEKHILTNPYNHHKLSRTLSGFDVTTVDCNADKNSGWNGTTVNLTPNIAPEHQHFDSWGITGATIVNSSFNFNNSDVTAQALYAYDTPFNVTLQTDGHGNITANKTTGYAGDVITLSNTASAGYEFSSYTVTGATINGNNLTFAAQNCTAKANYVHNVSNYYTASGTFDVSGTGYLSTKLNTLAFTGDMGSANVFAIKSKQFRYKRGINLRNVSAYCFVSARGQTSTARATVYGIDVDEAYQIIPTAYTDTLTIPGSKTGSVDNMSGTVSLALGPSFVLDNNTAKTAQMTGYIIMSGELY